MGKGGLWKVWLAFIFLHAATKLSNSNSGGDSRNNTFFQQQRDILLGGVGLPSSVGLQWGNVGGSLMVMLCGSDGVCNNGFRWLKNTTLMTNMVRMRLEGFGSGLSKTIDCEYFPGVDVCVWFA
jgi:hypothetical protein